MTERDGFGWLCPTPGHRARMLDMGKRVERARTFAVGAAGAGMFATVGDTGLVGVGLFIIAVVNLATLEARIRRSLRPERAVAFSQLLMTGMVGAWVVMTGGGDSPVLALLVVPVAMAAARFRAPVVWAAAGISALTILLATAIAGAHAAFAHPLPLLVAFALLIGVTAVTTALMDAELQFRDQSTLDPLTGLLNRSGLEARFAEIAEQARLLDRPVCMILCDLDHFKQVNDNLGHECGDAVLREASAAMRSALRSFELLYRLGGEEFLVLLPGVDLPTGMEIAGTLRSAVELGRPGGIATTASFGVSVGSGDMIAFEDLYRAADDALYRAKDGGRNLVAGSGVELSPQHPESLAPLAAVG